MYRKCLKYLIGIVLLFPITCYANETINYNDVKLKFSLDESKWMENSVNDEEFVNGEWNSDCGSLVTGVYDIYNEFPSDELEGVSREYFNYKNLLKNEDDANTLLTLFESTYSTDNWNYKNYKVKFIEFSGTMELNGIVVYYDCYLTINNGYIFLMQYMRNANVNTKTCDNPISEIAESVESTIPVKIMDDNYLDGSNSILYLLIGIALTFICYEVYPFIRIKIMNKKYNQQEARKMILLNSIIVGLISYVITLSTGEYAAWSACPSILYYYINKKLWIKKKSETVKDNIEEYTCDNCGAKVDENVKEEIESNNEKK